MFMGKKLDTTLIYYASQSTRTIPFEPYERFKFLPKDPGIIPITGVMKLIGEHSALEISQSLSPYPYSKKITEFDARLPKYEKNYKYTDVNFGKDTCITHLSIMGRGLRTESFPNRSEADRYNLHIHQQIAYINFKSHHYVTKFEVQYRVHSSRKWTSVGIFLGNNDRLTEVRIQFGSAVFAQFFRIIPIHYVGSPSMRFVFYTPAIKEGHMSDNHMPQLSKTLTYTVTYPSKHQYGRQFANCNCDRCLGVTSHGAHRKNYRSDLSIKKLRTLNDLD